MHTIMDRYRQADEEERLSLFLSHRELREDFVALHFEEYREKNRKVERVPYRPLEVWFGALNRLWRRLAKLVPTP